MTLLHFDGFEGYGSEDVLSFWDSGSLIQSGSTIDQTGRRGGYCVNSPNWLNSSKIFLNWSNPDPYVDQIMTVGCAFKHSNTGNASDIMAIHELETGSTAIFIQLDPISDRLKFIRRAALTSTLQFTSEELEIDTWYYLEIQGKIGQLDGWMKLKINEQLVYEVSGLDTCPHPSESNKIGNVSFGAAIYGRHYFDDIYILDSLGTKNNDFLGDIRIDSINPNGAGNYTQLTPSVGNNYECVNEIDMDDSDYVEGANAGEIDSYVYADVPTDLDDTAIYGVQLRNQTIRTAESDNIKIKGLLRTGSTDYKEGTAQSLSDIFKSKIVIWEDDPSDSNIWTQAKINACEFGMEVG